MINQYENNVNIDNKDNWMLMFVIQRSKTSV